MSRLQFRSRPADEGRSVVTDRVWSAILVAAVLAVTVVLLVQLGARSADGSSGSPQPVPRSPEPAASSAAEHCRATTAARTILVSLGEQSMFLCERDRLVGVSPVTTGRVALGDGTPLGTWEINSRETNRYLNGDDYRVFVHYWLPFFGDFGFHDSSWQNFAYGDRALYKTRGSRGCIHVPRPEMDKLYRWAQVGTTVTIAR